ncbi:MAG: hypothetical protein LUE12_03585 [Ruminococcus sp.]|nr:hypothetical protein [Ruminococcus sp.]
MTKFSKSFISRQLLEIGLFGLAVDFALVMSYDLVEIDYKTNLVAFYCILPVASGLLIALFSNFITKHNVKALRRKEFSLKISKERSFFAVFSLVIIVASVLNMIFLFNKFQPYLEEALDYAQRMAYLKNETESSRQSVLEKVDARYKLYLYSAGISVAASCIFQTAIYLSLAKRLLDIYRNPSDFLAAKGKKR